jgi:thiamine biosynthesis lipoprotein
MEADALSTAVFVSGLEFGMELIYKTNVNGVIITKDKKVYVSKGLASAFHIQSTSKPYSYYYF